jgi:putative transposase
MSAAARSASEVEQFGRRQFSAVPARAVRDAGLLVEINRVFRDRELGRGLAGVHKGLAPIALRRSASRTGRSVARCTVERLMRQAGLQGLRRGRRSW